MIAENIRILRIVRLTWDGHDPGLSLRLTRVGSTVIHRIHGALIRKDTTTSRPPSAPKVERTYVPGDDRVTRQCILVGDSLNDEEWSDDLSNPSSYQTIVRRPRPLESTDLCLSKDLVGYVLNCSIWLIKKPGFWVRARRSNNKQRSHSVERKRLEEHCDDGIV